MRGGRPAAPYQTQSGRGCLCPALEVAGKNAAPFLCRPRVALAMSRLFLAHWAASGPQAGPAALEDPAGFHLNPERPQMPARIQGIPLPPDRPELNPVEAGGDVTKDRIGSTLGATLAALAAATGEEVRPVY